MVLGVVVCGYGNIRFHTNERPPVRDPRVDLWVDRAGTNFGPFKNVKNPNFQSDERIP